jgi:redox-sensitive bicupin YhaK (pirin superfamily)
MSIVIYPPDQQAVGEFDGGKITEQKPIGFPGEGSAVKRVGPLFYWAWAHAEKEGYIPLHPHQAFEILTYVIQGQAVHGDTLGTKSVVGMGGVQVMKTGSGVSHEERFIGPNAEAFQIWFEPYIQDALKRTPTYDQYDADAFPITRQDGLQMETVIGENSPINLVTDVKMWDAQLAPGSSYKHTIPTGYTLATLALRGDGVWEDEDSYAFNHKDFILLEAKSEKEVTLKAGVSQELRVIMIEVPTIPDYQLYPKR